MRWGYKTVHYELKKEGLLGSTFLDEAEVEESLNEFGRAGWELVSLMEVKDGLIGVFKQPLDAPIASKVIGDDKPRRTPVMGATKSSKNDSIEVVEEYEIVEAEDLLENTTDEDKEVGEIRIE